MGRSFIMRVSSSQPLQRTPTRRMVIVSLLYTERNPKSTEGREELSCEIIFVWRRNVPIRADMKNIPKKLDYIIRHQDSEC